MSARTCLALALLLALVAACGSDRSAVPPQEPTPSIAASEPGRPSGLNTPPAAAPACVIADATEPGAGDGQPATGAPTIERALTALAQVRSYRAAVARTSLVGGSAGIPTGTTVTVVRSQQLAFDAVTAAVGEEGTPYSFAVRAIGDTAWRTSDGDWYPEYGTAAELLPMSLGPQDFDAFAGVVAGTRVADEVRDGRAVIHWRTTSRETPLDPASIGLETGTTFTLDLWVDATLGYAVSAAICDSGTLQSGTAFRHATHLEVSGIDDPTLVVMPPTLWSETH